MPETLLRGAGMPVGAVLGVGFRERSREADDGLDATFTHGPSLTQRMIVFNATLPRAHPPFQPGAAMNR